MLQDGLFGSFQPQERKETDSLTSLAHRVTERVREDIDAGVGISDEDALSPPRLVVVPSPCITVFPSGIVGPVLGEDEADDVIRRPLGEAILLIRLDHVVRRRDDVGEATGKRLIVAQGAERVDGDHDSVSPSDPDTHRGAKGVHPGISPLRATPGDGTLYQLKQQPVSA